MWLRRATRSLATISLATLSIMVLLVIAAYYVGDYLFFIPIVGSVMAWIIVVALAIMFVAGLPVAAIWGSARRTANRQIRLATPHMQRWAGQHGWPYASTTAPEGAEACRDVVRALAHNGDKLDLVPSTSDQLDHPLHDVVLGDDVVSFRSRNVQAPVWDARVVAVRHSFRLPPFAILDREADELWVQQAQTFESADFNDRWRVVAPKLKYGSDMAHQRLMQLLIDAPLDVDRVDLVRGWIVSWVPLDCTAEQLDAHVALLRQIADWVPRFLIGTTR